MRPLLVVRLFLRSARVRRKRAALTMAAIAWGTLSLLLLLAFGEGLRARLVAANEAMGKDIAIVWPGTTTRPFGGLPAGRFIPLRATDLPLLRARVPDLDGLVGEAMRWDVPLRVGRKMRSTLVVGTEPAYGRLRVHVPRPGGRFLDALDLRDRRRVIFLGDRLAADLFGEGVDPVGRRVLVGGVPYTVIGVMRHKLQTSNYATPDHDHAVIPLSTWRAQFGWNGLNNIVLRPRDPARMEATLAALRRVLAGKYRFDPADEQALPTWDTVKSGKVLRAILYGIEVFLGLIGALTLVVGGVGVANIMVAVVRERTREIGVQMALGARRSWITGVLVLESAWYTLAGGAVGIALALGVVALVDRIPVSEDGPLALLGRPRVSPGIGIAAAAILGLVGLLAGWFPARRAASIQPADALREE